MAKRRNTRKKNPDLSVCDMDDIDEIDDKYIMASPQMRISVAKSILQGVGMPSNFKFRELQIQSIRQCIKNLLANKQKSSMSKIIMITGSPGAGKTVSVNYILRNCDYRVISLNSNIIKKKKDVQKILAEQLLKKEIDEKDLTTFKIISELQSLPNQQPCILYIEEVELFFNSVQQFLSEQFFSLFSNKNLKIVLIGISNTIDALEKYGPKLSVKASNVTNIVFNPYSIKQIQMIVSERIELAYRTTGIKIVISSKSLMFAINKLYELKKGDMRIVSEFLKKLGEQIFPQTEELVETLPEEINVGFQSIISSLKQIKVKNANLINSQPFCQQAILIGLYCYITQYDDVVVTEENLKKKVKEVYEGIKLDQPKIDVFNHSLVDLEVYGFITCRQLILNKQKIVNRYFLKAQLSDIKNAFEDHPLLGKFVK